jgi:predicted O-methyltransferase YrrM
LLENGDADDTSVVALNARIGVNDRGYLIDSITASLASSETFLPTLEYLYRLYGNEIAEHRKIMREWCLSSKKCKFCDLEVEMLYMLIREIQPKRIFEMSPDKGYTTMWILRALQLNEQVGHLTSVDIHDKSLKFIPDSYRDHWTFYMDDFEIAINKNHINISDFDFILIDAMHSNEFAKRYIDVVLKAHQKPVAVVIHDIINDGYGEEGGWEALEVYKYLAFAGVAVVGETVGVGDVTNIFTMSPKSCPNPLSVLPNCLQKINTIRSKVGVTKPCDDNTENSASCSDESFDLLYTNKPEWVGTSNPAIFFALNTKYT